ncbi:MAG TPA: glutathione peroxidase [Steroidobacteraceae bacterium]|nr:glutathione peroxidase [Steroidobacteraceae bacterium]
MSVYDFEAKTIDGKQQKLDTFKGKALLVVNVASKCGFTPQYKGLEEIYRKYKSRGFEILGFPCDQFGHQEPGDEAEIKNFCSTRYDVSFPMFAKIEVNGDQAHPLYQYLKHEKPGVLGTEKIKWNFTKFLVDKAGQVTERYAPTDTPATIAKDLEKVLA